MKNQMLNIMRNQLTNTEETLAKCQADIKWLVERDIDTPTFERNAIPILLTMKELKSKIEVLKHNIQVIEMGK